MDCFQQGSATANSSLSLLGSALLLELQAGDYGVVSFAASDLRCFCLWGMLKDILYNNNPETESMKTMVSSVSRADLRCAVKSMFVACDACLWAKGKTCSPSH